MSVGDTHTHTELPFIQRAAKLLPGRTIGCTNPGLVAQGDGWNHVRLVKIQGENISPSALARSPVNWFSFYEIPISTQVGCGFWGLGTGFP